jgi:Lar family restriction alleviation protein
MTDHKPLSEGEMFLLPEWDHIDPQVRANIIIGASALAAQRGEPAPTSFEYYAAFREFLPRTSPKPLDGEAEIAPGDLLPCPFCGHEAEFERRGDHRASCIVTCTHCGCRLETGEEGDFIGQAWNTRVRARSTQKEATETEVLAALDLAFLSSDVVYIIDRLAKAGLRIVRDAT